MLFDSVVRRSRGPPVDGEPSDAGAQPWRCLWRGFSQITMTRPWRRITLHLSQIGLTLGLTFIERPFWVVGCSRPQAGGYLYR